MKKELILSFILVFTMTGFVSAQLTNYSGDCTDTDKGLNYYLKGTATYNGFDYEDSCVTDPVVVNKGQPNEYILEVGDLQEYACYYPESEQRCYSTACPFIKYHCPYGCEDGACLSPSTNVPHCFFNSLKGYSWYDDNGAVKFGVDCLSCSPLYKNIGTTEEGWYSSCDDSLIKLTFPVPPVEEIKGCTSSDGKEPYERGTTDFDGSSTIEICVWDDGKPTNGEEGTQVTESWCENDEKKFEIIKCLNGCKEGACIKTIPEEDSPIEIPEGVKEGEEEKLICQGCPLDGKCYPFGYRNSGNYCSDSQEFIPQLESDSICENNFECSTNLCIDSQCVSSGLWQKFLEWLRKIFG